MKIIRPSPGASANAETVIVIVMALVTIFIDMFFDSQTTMIQW